MLKCGRRPAQEGDKRQAGRGCDGREVKQHHDVRVDEKGCGEEDPQRYHHPYPGFEFGDLTSRPAPWKEACQHGPDAGEDVRHPGEVGDDVVAVEPEERQKLVQHLELQQQDDEDQDFEIGHQIDAQRRQHDQCVEVHPAQVGSKPSRFAKPVGIGDVGVEGGPDEIEPDTHHSGTRPPVAAAGGMPAFVKSG